MAKEEHGQDSPLSVVQAMYEAVNTRDWDTGFGLLTEDFEWHEPAQAFHTGTHRGFDEIRQRLEDQLEVFDELTIEPLEFHERGEPIAVPVRQRPAVKGAASRSKSGSAICGRSATGGSPAWMSSPPAMTRCALRTKPRRRL
jgi:ketosteroid isomerase-like protein